MCMAMFYGVGLALYTHRLHHKTTHTIPSPLEAHMVTYLNNSDNTHQVTWGALRGNLDYMELLMKQQGNNMEVLIPTWRYQHTEFPTTKIMDMKKDGDTAPLEVHTGFKYNLDMKIFGDMDVWSVGEMIKGALETMKELYGGRVHLTTASTCSNGNQGKLDRIEAPTQTHTE